jgi:UDP-N-acetylmuramate-alanine ligase
MPIDGVSSERLAKAVEAAHGPRVILAHTFPEAAEAAAQALKPGALLATIGAGDVYRIGELIRGGTR